jgi:hypothetical protein
MTGISDASLIAGKISLEHGVKLRVRTSACLDAGTL